MTIVYIVIIPNGMILAAYVREHHADTHARAVLGARVQQLVVMNQLTESIIDGISSEDWDNGETPVQEPESDITKTQPSTPRSKKASKPPG